MDAPPLRFLADENCDRALIRSLREASYDVFAVGEVEKRTDDRELIERAHREGRILLTEDKDFGWLVFVSHAQSAGVILIRFPGHARQLMIQSVVRVVAEQAARLYGAFVVIQPGQIRISHRPASAND